MFGVGWVQPGGVNIVYPGKGVMPFANDRISVSFEKQPLAGTDRHMNVLEMNDGQIVDTGTAFKLNEKHPNLMGYWGWYNINMEVTVWNESSTVDSTAWGPFCTGGHGGARTMLDFDQCEASGGVLLTKGPGHVCAKKDLSHVFCDIDDELPFYKYLLRSTYHWNADWSWQSDADTQTPLSSFLCDPIPNQPRRGVGFMIGCKPASKTIGTYQVKFCPDIPPPPPPPTPPPPPGPIVAGEIRSKVAVGKCLDIPGGDLSNGNLLWVWNCQGYDNQKWYFKDGQLVSAKNEKKCVDLPGNYIKPNAPLWMWDCTGKPQQKWGYDPKMGTIYLATSSDATICMALKDGNPKSPTRTPIIIENCTGSPEQQWEYETSHRDRAIVI